MSIETPPKNGSPIPTGSARILRHTEVCSRLGVGKSTLFAMIARNVFPQPFQIIPGGRATGWLEPEVEAWIESRRDQKNGRVAV